MDTPTETDRNKATVTLFFARMSAGQVSDAFDLLTENGSWFSLSTRQFTGREQMQATVERVNASVLQAPIVHTITTLTAEDNRVAVLSEGHAVTRAGVHYDQAYHFLVEFSGERISRIWEFNDTFHARTVFALDTTGKLPNSDLA